MRYVERVEFAQALHEKLTDRERASRLTIRGPREATLWNPADRTRSAAPIGSDIHTGGHATKATYDEALAFEGLPDHRKLMALIGEGKVPRRVVATSPVWRTKDAGLRLHDARDGGYRVPDGFLRDIGSYGEREVGEALAEYGLMWWPQFVVGDPRAEWKCPWVADFLVIGWHKVPGDGWRWAGDPPPAHQFRLLLVEVDGHHHDVRAERDADRDATLTALGYEVWRAPAAWARIDPFAVVTQLLEDAGLVRGLTLAHPPTLGEYFCARCGGPMIRYSPGDVAGWDGRRFFHFECHPIERGDEDSSRWFYERGDE